MGSERLTMQVAEWISALRHGDVPTETRQALRLLALDTIGAALFGCDRPWTQAIRSWALAAAPGRAEKGRARIWGDNAAVLRASDAALVNGASAHAYELDDYHNAKLHPGSVVVPAALALGEAEDCDGALVETAIAAGYEVMIRTSLALDPSAGRLKGWHLTAVCGTFGAAAAAAVLLRLNPEQTAWALGLAGTQSGGLFAFTTDGSNSKRLHPGRAAQSGIMAAELAALGLSGPTVIYEAEDGGFLKAFVDKPDGSRLIDGLGTRWLAADTAFKPYSCCGSLHSHVDAALQLRGRYRPGASVRVGLPKVVDVQCGYPYEAGSELNAQMSARYCVAAALMDGDVLPAQFLPERIADAGITSLAQSVELVHDPELDKLYPRLFAGWVEIEGERVSLTNPSGNPANPEMAASLRRKFKVLAEPLLGVGGASGLAAILGDLDSTTARRVVDRTVLPVRVAA